MRSARPGRAIITATVASLAAAVAVAVPALGDDSSGEVSIDGVTPAVETVKAETVEMNSDAITELELAMPLEDGEEMTAVADGCEWDKGEAGESAVAPAVRADAPSVEAEEGSVDDVVETIPADELSGDDCMVELEDVGPIDDEAVEGVYETVEEGR